MKDITFRSLKKNLKKDFSKFKKLKIAVLGDSATQMYVQALNGYGYNIEVDFEIFEADYDQIELQTFDSNSEFYEFKADYVVVIYCINKLYKKFGKLENEDKSKFSDKIISGFNALQQSINKSLNTKIIFFNFNEINDSVFGNYANKTETSFIYQTRKINFELMDFAKDLKNVFIQDICLLQSQYGSDALMDNKFYVNTELFFKIDILPIIAKNTADIIQSIEGKFKKCLILDLDNTVWGGIIGDDGIENIQIGDLGIGKAFTELQIWAKLLKHRGVILAVCSKNDEVNAKEPFEKHPEMILSLEDISVFVANWDNKADNINYIQKVLNIGFDSMVFLDDNPFERNMVRSHIADITVPELPHDPAEYMTYIRSLNLFETASYTNEDEIRTSKYQVEAKRAVAQEKFVNETDFIESLEMECKVESFNKFNTPRVAQLTQRSNQFNLRTIRYSEQEVENLRNNKSCVTRAYSLNDKYGEYGLISLVILKKSDPKTLFIDTWIMSCRVLKRDVDKFVLNTLVQAALDIKCDTIVGEYIRTTKNSIVENHYKDLGFSKEGDFWELKLNKYKKMNCYISEI
ncbi:HAD-IIIC family phosphatase [Aureibaculum sp. 2210JD6-5]|uniref:HAD-IIIC family phosphatase n=1 Tax=Aureibaculum sp. 2210JD6-5 TaxID=3103957 RepID=UPI002AAD67BE|nr:HAD-IIIC family phosphatase [Aureibaculum sp. 2210JD6-5]MDY7394008.1 HAD-IIIC family phosphatase [Aureibaculum sp. 2210JD6-5]